VNPHWPPTFNVIYVPGTVRLLFDFAHSAAEHSPYRFRLVSNACTAEEESFLAEKASGHPRLEFSSLESKTVLLHGEALQRLCRNQSADYFAFLDSDIFARGPFLTEAQSLLARHVALFSGLPTWLPPEERVMPGHFVFMGGRFTQTDGGLCLGVSYCAMYRRVELETVMGRTGLTFHKRGWSELSPEQRALLSKMKLEKRRYDTTKLVNLMLAQSGFSLVMCPERNLVHVGALSSFSIRPSRLTGRIIGRLREIVQANWPCSVPRRRAFEREMARNVVRRRRLVEDYFQHLLAGGPADGGPARSFPANGRQQLVETGRELLALRRRYAGESC
jgi:hypothetical protein